MLAPASSSATLISVRIGTDNVFTRYLFRRRYSARSYVANELMKRFRSEFSHVLIDDIVHVAGKENTYADLSSRGGKINVEDHGDILKSLQRFLGVSPVDIKGGWSAAGLPIFEDSSVPEDNIRPDSE